MIRETKTVIVFPRGQLTKSDRAVLAKNGMVPVEADDPMKVVTVLPVATVVFSDDITIALLDAMYRSNHDDVRNKFATALAARALRRVEKQMGDKS
jgi:hypothetical protein